MPSDVVCRLSPSAWRREGSRDIVQRARSRVDKLLREHEPRPLQGDAGKGLDQVLRDILHRYGLPDDLVERMAS